MAVPHLQIKKKRQLRSWATVMQYDAESMDISFLTFRDNLLLLPSGDVSALEDGITTLSRNVGNPVTRRHIPEYCV